MRSENRNSRLVLLSLLAAFSLGVAGPAVAGEPGDFEAALAQAAKEDKVLVVDFFTDW